MAKVEKNACLSTSLASSFDPQEASGVMARKGSVEEEVLEAEVKETASPSRRRTDYVLAIAYVVVYLEVGWLILMLLRSYSRD